MSQEQPRRAEEDLRDPIKYGDVFNISGDLSTKAVAPQDAAMMQAAETRVYGQTKKGGPASSMQMAATMNEKAGLVAHFDVSDVAGDQGVTVVETDVPGARIFTESVGGQVVAQFIEQAPVQPSDAVSKVKESAAITIGEALEATAQISGEKPVDQSDAAAIQAAEVRATGSNVITPGGLASTAQSAASHNAKTTGKKDKINLGDVLTNATTRLPADKAATRQDAEGVVNAELRNDPELRTHAGGVAASVAAAARLNEPDNK